MYYFMSYSAVVFYFYGEINKTNIDVLPKGPKKKASKGKPTTIYAIEIYDLFSLLKIEPTFDTISKLIKLKKHDIINEILSKNLIISDKKLLDITIKTFDIKLIDMILKYKITPDIETLNIIINKHLSDKYTKSKKILEILELLIHYGLQINFDNIKDLLSANLYVNNLERFNIPYDEDLYFVCYINSYFPEEYMKKFTIDKNVLTMRHYQWKKNNTTKIDSHISEKGTYSDIIISNDGPFENLEKQLKAIVPLSVIEQEEPDHRCNTVLVMLAILCFFIFALKIISE